MQLMTRVYRSDPPAHVNKPRNLRMAAELQILNRRLWLPHAGRGICNSVSAVLNGVLAAPLMAVIIHMASSKKVMDKFTIPLYLRIVGWAATAVMFAVSVGVFATWQ